MARAAPRGAGGEGPAVPVSSSILCPSTFISAAPGAARLGATASGECARPSWGEERRRRGGQQERGAQQEEQPGAESALAAPYAALPPPNRFKKIHQLHHRAPLKGARRHLVGVNSGRRKERGGWVRVTLHKAEEGAPGPSARTKRPGHPRCRGLGGGSEAVVLGVLESDRESEEDELGRGGVGWGGGTALVGEAWPRDKAAGPWV